MDNLTALSTQLGVALKSRGFMLTLAESCTGGMVAEVVTRVAGSSAWFDRGYVTYSNVAKVDMLGVSSKTLEVFGAVSEQTAIEMAQGALNNSASQIAASITGIAGPDGGTTTKPVGTVCFAWAQLNQPTISTTKQFQGNRAQVRQQAAELLMIELINQLSA